MKLIASVVTALAAMSWVSLAGALTVSDPSDWSSGWAYSTVEVSGAGTSSLIVEATGGNPGARLNSTTVTPLPADTAFGAAMYQAVTVAAPTSGTPFVMRIDVLSGAGDFGQGQGVQALVGQGGSIYQTSLGITGFPFSSFTTLSFNGTFVASGFTKISGPGPATPAFDGVTPTSFGFAVGNNKSATLTQYYDNWNITFTSVGPIPTLSPWSLALLTAFVLIAAFIARRYRRR